MLVTALVLRCRHGHKLLLGSLSQAARFRPYSTHGASHPDAISDSIRNIGIIAHVDAGKTTTTERMLYYSGMIRHLGNVDDRNTTTDFLELEAQRKITIQSAAISFRWPPKDKCPPGVEPKIINLIDTPGHGDFRFEVDRCMPILDGAVCILDAVKGVETHTERVWASAHQFKIPRILFVNKLDRDGASFKNSILDVATRLQARPLLCQIPWWKGDEFVGVIDVIEQVGLKFSSTGELTKVDLAKALAESNPGLLSEVEKAHQRLIEELCDRDEKLMNQFLEENDISVTDIKDGIRRLISDGEGTVVPVFAGASRKNMGVQPLLDAVVEYLPSPRERPEVVVISGKHEYPLSKILNETANTKKGHGHHQVLGALASVFKVVDDPDRGPLSFVRVYYGTLPKRASMWNTSMHQFEKPQNMFQIAASKTYDIPQLSSGQIGAITGLKNARTGDTLITFPGREAPESARSIQIRPPEIPPAVAVLAIEPFSVTDASGLEAVLARYHREDPSVRWAKDEKTEQYLVYGMGKLHLEIVEHRLRTHYKVPKSVEFKGVQVEYRECVISHIGPYRAEYERTVANKAGKAACSVTLEPLEDHHRDNLHESCIERDGNIIHVSIPLPESGEPLPFDPEEKRQQLFNGAVAALARGPRRGYGVSNTLVTITYNSETDFFGEVSGAHIVNAAIHAVRDALKQANATQAIGILEPVMKVDIFCPEDAWGNVQHDLQSARGGVVLEINDPNGDTAPVDGGIDVSPVYVPPDPYEMVHSLQDRKKGSVRMLQVVARAPFKEMLAYDEILRGMTQGRHSIHLELDTWERVTGPREKALENMGF
ncbi:P-loop containing nucleoside triphosphate hydrolase protein [Coniochaeta ligniaria NRRL 30616]|uniref:p-loop containing nucleoside triphosphate hydrolase protein n=1 Tax=Coniochaeta ligniaria NRRL 30616 TaxID=1408157 RepID=A0A1J7JGL7_9PEZI|nr:P-loop containing nucleoside triphosphate hydrolase protein [Coniochaeta ligniaria NRRL 30616]